jgi:hypothetical protein
MPIKLTLHLAQPGQEPSIPRVLGITDRVEHLQRVIQQVGSRQKGTYVDDFMFFAREADNNEEYTYMLFQYGITVGTNMAMQARITQKN